MNAEEPKGREERLLRALYDGDATPEGGEEARWLAEQRRLSNLLRAACPQPRRLPDGAAFYRRLERRLARPQAWTLGDLLRLWLQPRWVAAAACAALLAVVWWQWPVTVGPDSAGSRPDFAANVVSNGPPPAAELLAEVDEIDADTHVTTYQLPGSLTPVVMFSWSTESENHVPSG
ncbi:hypothetical protein HS125_06060 [bacterium]|nr:hypothetical protein [bacterium]